MKLVVPYAPGGSADIVGRLIADEWGKALGKSMFIENKAGAGGNLGVDAVAKSAADGYTIGLQTVTLAINPSLTTKMPYDTLKDLTRGKLRALGVTGSKRSPLLPNVPTIAEAGLPVTRSRPGSSCLRRRPRPSP